VPHVFTLGVVYGLLVFAAGFALGIARVLVVEPAIGRGAAVALEFPLIAMASWFAARFTVTRLPPPRATMSRFGLGAIGFSVLQAGEIVTGVLAFGRPLADVLAGYARADGLVALGLQSIVVVFPLFVGKWSKPPA
jgi:hypothetical protein